MPNEDDAVRAVATIASDRSKVAPGGDFYARNHDAYARGQADCCEGIAVNAWTPNEHALWRTFDDVFVYTARLLGRLFRGEARVGLDVGCGPGRVNARHFPGYVVHACDASPAVVTSIIDGADANGAAFHCFEYRAPAALPFADGALDFCLCTSVVQHVDSFADVRRLLAEVARVVRPRGLFLFVFKEGAHDTKIRLHDPLYGVRRTFRVFDRAAVREAVAGDWIVHDEGYGPDHKRCMHSALVLQRRM
jgi:SAM-dependent methyltransferase